MGFTAWACRHPDIPVLVPPSITTAVGVSNPIIATLGAAVAFRVTWPSWSLGSIGVISISRWLREHRPHNIPAKPSANARTNKPTNDCAHRPKRRAHSSACIGAGQWIQAVGVNVANRVAADVRIRVDAPGQANRVTLDVDPPRGEFTVPRPRRQARLYEGGRVEEDGLRQRLRDRIGSGPFSRGRAHADKRMRSARTWPTPRPSFLAAGCCCSAVRCRGVHRG